jgi:hypothetical protein
MPGPDSLEIEWKLAVVSDDPRAVLDRIAHVDRLTGWRFPMLPDRHLRDVYLDTRDDRLSRRAVALRVRADSRSERVTLKGRGDTDDAGRATRPEAEIRDPDDAAKWVIEKLAEWGIDRIATAEPPDDIESVDRLGAGRSTPVEPDAGAMPPLARRLAAALGLRLLQDRMTIRIARRVVDPEGRVRGEMALDTVTYRVRGRVAVHREVEIEAATSNEADAAGLEALVRALRDRFGEALRPCPVDKLRLGLALERLEGRGRLVEHLRPDGSLDRAFYETLRREPGGVENEEGARGA